MPTCKVRCFGRFAIERDQQPVCTLEAHKVQELFCYLLIFRNHPHPREQLAETLWGNQPADRSRKQLRQTLWRLQSALREFDSYFDHELLIDNNWIQFQLPSNLWLDVAEFENTYHTIYQKNIQEISPSDFELMQAASQSYQGDLLEGWYQDWCTFERERFQVMHLMLLDKIVQFCLYHQRYEAGLVYGMKILHHDYAYERAHRQLMQLYFLTGNRTQALHQYERCTAALLDQLGVEPSESTKHIYEQIRSDTYRPLFEPLEDAHSQIGESVNPRLETMLCHVDEALETMITLRRQIHDEIANLNGGFVDRE